ncbi:uncharacterized protein PODANS_5_1260 [Podospora anserina S mat+]|uniref:Cytochrome P450 pisatin demethylase-like n=1 Tax=Podospora anserina (strain S / ATCC MYA-4624 / DSM 980 / FGSC 10383) TaxID=515849 RepID=B2AEX0_PODAN|nr:uncharacterized protein PODANS_5_1260 [Podospora anserina S mat+]CAP61987.1 unnamed protein product [Podospora anserina S mat+]CDP29063.1 Putative cytochrome P450 pisatin demethylase-like [Podospora anserina S mat+]
MSILGLVTLSQAAVVAAVCFVVGRALYNAFFHPLAVFPGPRLWASSRVPYAANLVRGRLHHRIKQLHDQYGPVVRIAPDELSFTLDGAWHDIYCGGYGNKGFPKHDAYRNAQTFVSLFDADDENHTRLRNLLGKEFFSLNSARRQERIVQEYTTLMISQLRKQYVKTKQPADMREWYNFLTFDVAARVTLSEDFGCLEKRTYHPWIEMVLTHFKLSALLMISRFYPPSSSLLFTLAPARLMEMRDTFIRLVREKIERRMSRTLPPDDNDDFVTAALGKGVEKGLTKDELEANCILLLLAGSETMTTSLLGATHYLCENPAVLRRMTAEVRATVTSEEQLTFGFITENMPYLNAVLKETQRLCPPVANGPARVVNRPGTMIAGFPVPEGTAVGVTQFAANRQTSNFTRPNDFVPERWLSVEQAGQIGEKIGDSALAQDVEQFSGDVRSVVRPFVVGGRDCIGQNLSWVEFRVVLARMLWNFDMEVVREEKFPSFNQWTDQKAFELWQKEPYHVSLTERTSL